MSKLTTLYRVLKNMKQNDTFKGKLDLKVTEDHKDILNVTKIIYKDSEAFKMDSEVNISLKSREMKHKSTTEFKGQWPKGMRCQETCSSGSKKQSFKKMLFFIKTLDLLELQKLEDGFKTLTIEMDEKQLPEEFKDMISKKMMNCNQNNSNRGSFGFEKEKEYIHECVGVYNHFEKFKLQVRVNKNDKIEELNLTMIFKNEEEKALEVQLNGKMEER